MTAQIETKHLNEHFSPHVLSKWDLEAGPRAFKDQSPPSDQSLFILLWY